ncbi:hypothetical protein [Streptomyces lydicus]|uniref:hypothetical protein n=1 Tax=Streptomyces lydicus TaxID=47763 RepID=UPI0037906A8B
MSTSAGHFGEYNHIYLITKNGFTTGVCDRAHGKPAVGFFEEPMMDLAEPLREPARFSFAGPITAPDQEQSIAVGGQAFPVTGQGHSTHPMGFGRGLVYQVVASDRPGYSAVLLTIELPERVRYSLRWVSEGQAGNAFQLQHGVRVTVMGDLPWFWDGSACTVETGDTKGRVTLLIESVLDPQCLQDIVIVAAKGWEREALLIRVACGRGFVPCFVVSTEQWADRVTASSLLGDKPPGTTVVGVGLDTVPELEQLEVDFIRAGRVRSSSAEAAEMLGRPCLSTTLTAPDCPQAHGPALYLAVTLGANLTLDPAADDRLQLTASDATSLRSWRLADLVGKVLPPPSDSSQMFPHAGEQHEEIVVCENSTHDLLICQAVGYADVRCCPIAFITEVTAQEPVRGFPDEAAGVQLLENHAAAAVPPELRNPHATTLTVFTRWLPLHLTPLPHTISGTQHWLDSYGLAHLPGHLGSVLIPRLLNGSLQRAPAVSFGLVFDALGTVVDTEGHVYADRLAAGLSYPLVLASRGARREVLESVLRHLDTDLVLLIAHGQDDYFQDSTNENIPEALIRTWRLRGQPVVFNNSCSSWATTGQAFVTVGARAVIGTLWPVANEVAAQIAATMGEHLHDPEEPDIATLLRRSVRASRTRRPDDLATRAAYVFIGLPGTAFHARPALNSDETLTMLAKTLPTLYGALEAIAEDGRPQAAATIHRAATVTLRERFTALLVAGELPKHLPPPFAEISVLDIDFLLARADVAFGRTLLHASAREHQPALAMQMSDPLHRALHELVNWEQRHDIHMGRSERTEGPLGETGMIRLSASFVLEDVLPFVRTLAEFDRPEAHHEARWWLQIAALLVTTPSDKSPDGSITDQALINRIRTGIIQRFTVAWSRQEGRAEGSDRAATIDLLGQAVNKSELANRFGVAQLQLGEPGRAAPFFEAARDLAPGGSDRRANAISNLAEALRQQAGLASESLTQYQEALAEQLRHRDWRNASVTAANMLRHASRSGAVLAPRFLPRALARTDAIEPENARLHHRCALLGAGACYRAAHGDYAAAARLRDENAACLDIAGPAPARHLPDLARWYHDAGDHARAVRQSIADGKALERAHLPDAAARSYLHAAAAALDAYDDGRTRHLEDFLECSKRLGTILRGRSRLAEQLGDGPKWAYENTTSLWRGFAERRWYRQALRAYYALQSWPGNHEEADWELLSYARHPRNEAAVKALAAHGLLRRTATVRATSDGTATLAVTTARGHNTADTPAIPPVIYGCLPFPGEPEPQPGVAFVAGAAIYELREGRPVTLHQSEYQPLPTDGRGTYLYRETWGSVSVLHDVEVILAPGLAPTSVQCAPRAGAKPDTAIQFRPDGCHITVRPPDDGSGIGEAYWLADLVVTFRSVPELSAALADPDSPFAHEIPIGLYSLLLQAAQHRR